MGIIVFDRGAWRRKLMSTVTVTATKIIKWKINWTFLESFSLGNFSPKTISHWICNFLFLFDFCCCWLLLYVEMNDNKIWAYGQTLRIPVTYSFSNSCFLMSFVLFRLLSSQFLLSPYNFFLKVVNYSIIEYKCSFVVFCLSCFSLVRPANEIRRLHDSENS